MSAIVVLMGLLALSFVGSLIVGRGAARGLASGIEYVGIGVVVGPHALGLVERQMITEFEPVVEVALGWLAFVVGLDFGRVDGRRVRAFPMMLGIGCALLTGVVVTLAVYRLLAPSSVVSVVGTQRFVFAASAGAVSAETTRFGIQWVQRRWAAKGRVSKLLVDLASADDLVPLVAAGAIFSFAPASGLALVLPTWGWFLASLALGALLGTITAMLLRAVEGDAVWGALIGTLLLGVGTAQRFGFCSVFVTFVMGIALAALSPARRALRRLVGATEGAVLYPMLLLAGARLDLRLVADDPRIVTIVALVLLARIVSKIVGGFVVRVTASEAKPAGAWLGLVMLSSGPVSMSCALVFALRFPGFIGDTLLLCAAASAVLGEIISALAVKPLLRHLGELVPVAEARDSLEIEGPAPRSGNEAAR